MTTLSPELRSHLMNASSPTTVLVKVKERYQPKKTDRRREAVYASYRQAAERNYADLVRALQEEQARDDRVRFNPVGMFNEVAVSAPSQVIEKLAERPDVDEIVLDEPTDVIDVELGAEFEGDDVSEVTG